MCCSTVLFDCKCIHISKTLQRILCPDAKDGKKTRIVIDTPKSKSSNRVVPLSDFLFEKLSAHRSDDPETYVLTGKEKYMEPRVFEYHFDKLMRTCALQDVHFHTLRHTFTTRCIESGCRSRHWARSSVIPASPLRWTAMDTAPWKPKACWSITCVPWCEHGQNYSHQSWKCPIVSGIFCFLWKWE